MSVIIVDAWFRDTYHFRVQVKDSNGRVFNYPLTTSFVEAVLFRSKVSQDLGIYIAG